MLSTIKNIFSSNKKRKLFVAILSLFTIISIIFSYFESNIQKIISNEFSRQGSFEVKLDDVDFNLLGNLSFKNITIYNSKKDTLFFTPLIVVNPKSIQNALIKREFDFDEVIIREGKLYSTNFENINFLNSKNSSIDELLIKNLTLKNFDFFINGLKNRTNFNITNLRLVKDSVDFSLTNSFLDVNNENKYENINVFFSKKNNKIKLDDLNFLYKNSSFSLDANINGVNKIDSIIFTGLIKNSRIISSDFFSKSKKNSFIFNSKFSGDATKILFSELELTGDKTQLNANLGFDLPLNNRFTSVFFNFNELRSSSSDLLDLYPDIFGSILPSSLKNIGSFSMKGDIFYNPKQIKSKIQLENNNGKIYSDLNINDFKNIDNASYKGTFQGVNIDLSNFINIPFLGKSTFQFTIDGRGFVSELLNSSLEGKIDKLNINDYDYKNIIISGDVSDKVFNGRLNINDKNIKMDFAGLIDYSDKFIDFDFSTNISNANIGKLNLTLADDNSLAGTITTKLRGSKISDLIGDISFKNFIYRLGENVYEFDELLAQSRINNEKRIFNINSPDAVSGIIIGDLNFFKFNDILLNHLFSRYQNFDSGDFPYKDFSFNLNFKPKIAGVFKTQVDIDENTFLRGAFSSDKSFELILTSPYIEFNNLSLENVDVKITNNSGFLKFKKVDSKLFNGNDFIINTFFENDVTNFDIDFNTSKGKNQMNFNHTIDKNMRSLISFSKISFDYNNNRWLLDESIEINKNKFIFNNDYKELKSTKIKSGKQTIEFRYLNNENKFDFQSIFKSVNFSSLIPKPKNILYDGIVNGKVSLTKTGNIYSGKSNIVLKDFSSNGYILGDAYVDIESSELRDKYNIQVKLTEKDFDIFDVNGSFQIDDLDYPLNLDVKTKNFRIKPFSAIGENVLQNFDGYFDSEFNVSGSLQKPNFRGFIKAVNTSFDVPYLGVRYSFPENPSFELNQMSINIDAFKIKDLSKNSTGLMNGKITHNRLKDWFLDFEISSQNLLAINTNSDQNDIYYGVGMFSGKAKFFGPGKNLDINISGSTNPETKLTIPIKYDDGLGNLSYLTFSSQDGNSSPYNLNQGLELFIDLKLNNNAKIDIIFDEDSGSKLSGRGLGDFILESDYSGKFSLKGEFNTDFGKYHFKNFGIVERIFEIKKGANIVWDGDPYKGIINAEALYEVPGGANPSKLIQNASFNRKIPTFVNVLLVGELSNLQTPKFEIIFPNTRGSIKSELDYYLNDYEKKQTQAISLITQGFFTDSGSNSLVSSQTITNNLFQRASGIIDEIFTNPNDKMNVGINYFQGDRFASSSLLNRDRIGLSVQSEISDRILVNGKIGVPVGGTEENVILGNVQVEFLLNDSGNLKARIFNKENEYQFFGDEIGYTQGFGISYEVEFDTFSELIGKIKKSKKK